MTTYGAVLDIETVPSIACSQVEDYLAARLTSSNGPKAGLHPLFAKVISIGLKVPGAPANVEAGDDECALLHWVWDQLAEVAPSASRPLVTYNGYGFDLPFLKVRSTLHQIRATRSFNLNPWQMEGSNHFDVMRFLSGGQSFSWVSLPISCLQLGIAIPEEALTLRGEDIARYHAAGDWEAIRHHNALDVHLTEALFLRLRGIPATVSQPHS